ncbi:MAG: triple tyrosine motif-containing protein [Bacteroidota bacterium]
MFDPLTIADDNFQPSVALTGIYINNSLADFGSAYSPFDSAINSLTEIRLPYHQNFLTFEFAALEYNIPEQIRYRYMLDGFDAGWVNAENNNAAVYTKIPPGHYTLKINATNTAGKWSDHIKILPVIITPPFWKTWWFISLCAFAVVATVYSLLQLRISAIRKKEQQKAQFEREASELKAQAPAGTDEPPFYFQLS